ncbi:MAG: hypothetical protein K1W19_12795 [Lachnospiraceae bacterium]
MLEERKQQNLPESAQEAYKRPAYLVSRKAECKIYEETECGARSCCFECVKRFVCKEFEGVCGCDTRETYQNCPQIIQEQKDRK